MQFAMENLNMSSNSILPHQNDESILFIGGPLDGKYRPVAQGIDHYTLKNEESGEVKEQELVYRIRHYDWKDGRIIKMMVLDGVPDSYLKYLAKSLKDGVEDNVPLPVVIMCLASVEQFIDVN